MKCSFCNAPLPKKGATCNFCKQHNPLNARQLLLSQNAFKTSNHNCSRCQKSLLAIDNLYYCAECDGILIEEERLKELLETYKTKECYSSHIMRFILDNPRSKQQPNSPLKCPICQETMHSFNYQKTSGVILDLCEEHGIWLDGGELKQLNEWIRVNSI